LRWCLKVILLKHIDRAAKGLLSPGIAPQVAARRAAAPNARSLPPVRTTLDRADCLRLSSRLLLGSTRELVLSPQALRRTAAGGRDMLV
jgi:hypothetical protein